MGNALQSGFFEVVKSMSLQQLTDEQQAIIGHDHGHAKVVAVAGAGKTTTLALFIQQRLYLGDNPKRLLVIMYNKSAQIDFSKKLKQLIPHSPLPQVRTFHALGLKIYQSLISDGVLPSYQGELIGQSEQEYLLWRLMIQHADSSLSQEILQDKKKWLDPMMMFMEQAKASLEPPAIILKSLKLPKNCDFFVKVFESYEAWRKDNRRIAYADMIYDPCMLFSRRSDIATKFSNHMDWVLVDEYQDINPIQQFLMQTIAGVRASVIVIGDPDQTIYEFRGSSSKFMLEHFEANFPHPKKYSLSTSFRYGHDVALLSNQLIQYNKEREAVYCIANYQNPDTQVHIHQEDDELSSVLAIIQQSLAHNLPHEIAILVRLWGMTAPLELALLQHDIPYQMSHQGWVLDRYELQPFILLLQIASGEFAQNSINKRYQMLLQFLTFPALKIKRSELELVARQIAKQDCFDDKHSFDVALDDLSEWQQKQLHGRLDLLCLALDPRLFASQCFNRFIRETDFYKGVSESGFNRQQVDDRISTVKGFMNFVAKLNLPAVQTYAYLNQLKAKRSNQTKNEGIVLSSIHKAKGLEWPVVILPGVNSHYYPYQSDVDMKANGNIEEERRLFYVAMTRVKHSLHLVTPVKEAAGSSDAEMSPFIHDMAAAYLLKMRKYLKQGKTTIEIPKRAQAGARNYISALGWPIDVVNIQLEKIDGLAKPSSTIVSRALPYSAQIIEHTRFGRGQITIETQQHWHVLFEDGQVRVLDKTIAAPMIKYC